MTQKLLPLIAVCSLVLSACTCTKKLDPEETVKQFIELSAGAKDLGDKSKLLELCGGEMKAAFSGLSDEAFSKVYLSGAIKLEEFKVIEKKIEGENAQVSYMVKVDNRLGGVPGKEVNEREVLLSKTEGRWLIDGIRVKGSDKLTFTEGIVF